MCVAILVKRNGREDAICETVGELASALSKKPSEISPDPAENCLCNAYMEKLGAVNWSERTGDYEWPEYVIAAPKQKGRA